jgi:hypothetical protein
VVRAPELSDIGTHREEHQGALMETPLPLRQIPKTSSAKQDRGWIARPLTNLKLSLKTALEVGLIVGVSVVAVAGCAAPAEHEVEARVHVDATEPQIFGGAKDDDGNAIPGVVALRVGMGATFELCSGALLAPNLVLTARHCVTKTASASIACDENGLSADGKHVLANEEPATIGVYVGASPRFTERPSALGKTLITPKGDVLCDSDIALVVLDRALDDVTPLPIRLHAPARVGDTIRSVGYGQNDEKLPIGTRVRKSGVEVLAQGKALSQSNTPLGAHEFEVGKSICQGDSGGPAISEETGAVIGVVSRGGNCNEDFGHIYTTTAGFDALFDEAFAAAGTEPTLEERSAKDDRAPRIEDGANGDAARSSEGSCAASGRSRAGNLSRTWALGVGLALLGLGSRRRGRSASRTPSRETR